MYRKLFVTVSLILWLLPSFSQESKTPVFMKFGAVMSLYTDVCFNQPDGVDSSIINQGFSSSLMYIHPLGEKKFFATIGAGFGSHNFHSNGLLSKNENSEIEMILFDTAYANLSYKKNKLSVTYFDFPIELMFVTDKDYRFAIGVKPGFLLDGHTKYKGDNYPEEAKDKIKIKDKDLDNLENWRYAITARVGYRNLNFYAAYGLSGVYATDKGPGITPLSIGLAITSF